MVLELLQAFVLWGGVARMTANGGPYDVEVAKFRDDKPAAVSLTFDDGSAGQVAAGVPVMRHYQVTGSFFVITGLTRARKTDPVPTFKDHWAEVSWEEWREVREQGFEIGNHSVTHPFLTRLEPGQLNREIEAGAAKIAAEVGKTPVSFVCPYNDMNSRVKAAVLRSHPVLREEWTEFGGPGFTAAKGRREIDQAIREKRWLTPMIHGIGAGFHPISPATFENLVAYLAERRGELWIDTFGTIGLYRQEYQAANIELVRWSADKIRFRVACKLDPKKYPVPLTVVVRNHLGQWNNVTARDVKNGTALTVKNAGDKILVSVPRQTVEVEVGERDERRTMNVER